MNWDWMQKGDPVMMIGAGLLGFAGYAVYRLVARARAKKKSSGRA